MNPMLVTLFLLFFSFTAHAAPNTFGFNGYFTNSGAPVSNPAAPYVISVIALPSGCVLYTESGNVNISNGNFSINIGEGGTQNLFGKTKLSDAFNTTNSSIPGNACTANGTSSTWKMSVTLDGLSMGDVPLNSVPMAMWAERAETAGLSQNFAGSLAGDITGTQSTTTISKLQGISLNIAAPSSGHILTYNGSNWVNQAPTAGDITDVNPGAGLTGGATTGSATLSLAPIAAYSVLANPTGASATPTATSLSAILDTVTSTQGSVLFRGSTNWTYLAPGTSGQFLQTQGAGANPIWAAAGGSGDITDVLPGTGLTGGASSGSATLSVNVGMGINQIPQVGGSAIAANSIILSNGVASALTHLPPGANGDVLTMSAGVPIWIAPGGGLSGTGTIDKIVKFNGATTLTDSIMSESGSNIQIAGNIQVASGSASLPSLSFASDTNTGIYSPSVDTIAISTNGIQRLKINSLGWVSIGASSSGPLDTLFGSIQFSTETYFPAKIEAYSAETHSGTARGTNLRFSTATNGSDTATERLRIEHNGNVGIGTTNPSEKLEVNGNIRVATGSTVGMGYFRGTCGPAAASGLSCQCPNPTYQKIIGGGCYNSSSSAYLGDSYPLDDTTWQCYYSSGSVNITVYVICASIN